MLSKLNCGGLLVGDLVVIGCCAGHVFGFVLCFGFCAFGGVVDVGLWLILFCWVVVI